MLTTVPPREMTAISEVPPPICCGTISLLKGRLKIDDALDAFGCHGIGGGWGGIATGLFAKHSINPVARWDGLCLPVSAWIDGDHPEGICPLVDFPLEKRNLFTVLCKWNVLFKQCLRRMCTHSGIGGTAQFHVVILIISKFHRHAFCIFLLT